MDQVEQPENDSQRSGQHPRLGPAPPKPAEGQHHQSFWLWVMCLTGVDYFSTLGYLPSIAYKATGMVAPVATIILIVVTLLGALPIYAYVAARSPKGLGSIALLERMVSGWTGKFLVLALLGFVATAFIFTKTLSASDATKHLIENPLWKSALEDMPSVKAWLDSKQQVLLTMLLLMVLGAMFMRGFREVIGVAVFIVGIYLVLNLLIIGSGIVYLINNPAEISDWFKAVGQGGESWGLSGDESAPSWTAVGGIGVVVLFCLMSFPKLALGLSGFETGLMVMPLIRGNANDDPNNPQGRIRNTRKLLLTAALIMCVFLMGSSFITSVLISPYAHSGAAEDRALAYLAHGQGTEAPNNSRDINPWLFGEMFGTIYDISTIAILWFAGASAMAGLLNLVPQYLPRYGMAPDWARAVKPLILVFTLINVAVVWIFSAEVERQDGPYATGVLIFIFSGCTATLIDRWRSESGTGFARFVYWVSLSVFGFITLVFFYTTIQITRERPDGIFIAGIIILAIWAMSLWSRTARSRELRFMGFEFKDDHSKFLWESLQHLEFPVLVPHRPNGSRTLAEKEDTIRAEHRLTPEIPVVFIEVQVGDPSEFYQKPRMEILQEEGRFIVKVTRCTAIANSIAALGLELSKVGKPPEIHFGWSDVSPVKGAIGFILFGEGNVPWMVRELIRKEQPDEDQRPRVVVG